MKLLALIFMLLSLPFFSQQNYFVVTIDKYDSFYTKENERFFWIINPSEKKINISPLYFLNVDSEMEMLCDKNNQLGIFNRLENTLSGKNLDELLNKIYDNKNLVFSVNNKNAINKRHTKYKIYVTKIKTEKLFSCNIDNEEGAKINYQGLVFFLYKDFIIDHDILKSDHQKLDSLSLLNLNYIKTNPYEQIRFR
jgi:hypothetical protein